MRARLEVPRLSLRERDRRWAAARRAMGERGLDCLVLFGFPCNWDFTVANARYLAPLGGNAAFNVLVFPREGEPTSFVFMPTFVEYWKRAQDWVQDVRARKGPWAQSVASRLTELGLQAATIGLGGLAGPLDPDGWLPHSVYAGLCALLPGARLVNTDDLLERLRSIKSPEEIQALELAARLGDLMLEACREKARPGVKECEVYGKMMEVMLAHGGEEPTLFLWAADASPFPHPFRLPTMRPLERGDLILCEIHPKYGGYFTHVERTFSLGQPAGEYRRIYEGCLAAYETGLDFFRPGRKITEAMNAVRDAIAARGLGMRETGIHGHGLGSLEYPRYRHHAPEADEKALRVIGDEFKPGMVFAFNIDLFDPAWRNGETGCVFAETILVAQDQPRRLHRFSSAFQVIGV